MSLLAWTGAIAGFAALAGCLALGVKLGRSKRRAAVAAAAGGLALLLVRWYLRRHPEVEDEIFPFADYALLQPWWGAAAGLVMMGFGVVRAERAWLRVAAGVAAGMLLLASGHSAYAIASGGPPGLSGRPDATGVCRQTSSYSCGAAAAATLLAQVGIPADEREMARLCWTNRFTGTDVFPALRGVRKKLAGTGREARLVNGGWETLRGLPGPAMAVVYYSGLIDHWIVVLEAKEDRVVIADPLSGRREVSRERFMADWRGFVVAVE